MTKTTGRRLVAAVVGATVALLASATAAVAAPDGTTVARQGTAVASTGRLVLEPTDRGYLGHQTVTVRNTGTDTGYFRLLVREPVAGSFETSDPDQFCQFNRGSTTGLRAVYECSLSGIAPGGQLTFQLRFRALTTPQAYAMRTSGGAIAISDDFQYDSPFSRYAGFGTVFRSTDGSLRNPRPYVQDTVTDSSFVLHDDEVVLTRDADGWYHGRLTATVRYGTDAPHNWLWMDTVVPDDLAILVTTEPVAVPCWRSCEVPGPRFMEGEERTFDLVFEAGPESQPGAVAQATGSLAPFWHQSLPEVDTSDNSVAFTVRIAG